MTAPDNIYEPYIVTEHDRDTYSLPASYVGEKTFRYGYREFLDAMDKKCQDKKKNDSIPDKKKASLNAILRASPDFYDNFVFFKTSSTFCRITLKTYNDAKEFFRYVKDETDIVSEESSEDVSEEDEKQ